jgi:hypothetical protein
MAEHEHHEAEHTEAQTETTEEKAQPTTPGVQRPPLPEGIVSPITALNHLKQKGHAPQDFKPQQMYGFVKNPGKTDPFPVKHYDAEGNEHAAPKVDEHGITRTRPGVKISEVVDWWGRKGERTQAKLAEKAEKAKQAAEKAAAGSEPVEAEEEGNGDMAADSAEYENVDEAE